MILYTMERTLDMKARCPAQNAYYRRFMIFAFLYFFATAFAVRFIDNGAPLTPLTILLSLLPALAIIGWIWAVGRLLVEIDDEYLRMLEVRKAIVATGFLLVVCTIWGALDMFAGLPGFPSFLAFPVWCLGLVPGEIANRLWQ